MEGEVNIFLVECAITAATARALERCVTGLLPRGCVARQIQGWRGFVLCDDDDVTREIWER